MNLEKEKYIIVEIIPTHPDPSKGKLAQISALKLEGLQLLDRFDYRLKEVDNKDVFNMIQYDKTSFTYVDQDKDILEKWKAFSKGFPIVIFEDTYTKDYLQNKKFEMIYPYLNMKKSHSFFQELIHKYQLEPSDHLVDLIYEAIIMESNHKKGEE